MTRRRLVQAPCHVAIDEYAPHRKQPRSFSGLSPGEHGGLCCDHGGESVRPARSKRTPYYLRTPLTGFCSGYRIDSLFSPRMHGRAGSAASDQPILLKKVRYEPFKERVPFHTTYSDYFKQNVHLFAALDFLADWTQHIPPKGLQLIRRYGPDACSSSTR